MDGDPHGILEAEKSGVLNSKLVACSEDPACPEHAQALFWLAAEVLSHAGADIIEIDGCDLAVDAHTPADDIAASILERYQEHFEVDGKPSNYEFSDPEFVRGLRILHQAYDAGSPYASNELGLLFMEQDEFRDLELAATYLNEGWAKGDPNCAYNLARLQRLRAPDETEVILRFLESASILGGPSLRTMYLFGLEAFGSKVEKKAAKTALKKIEPELRVLNSEFRAHFSIE